jgi:hypothetical protein
MFFILLGSVVATIDSLTGGSLAGVMDTIHSFFRVAAG